MSRSSLASTRNCSLRSCSQSDFFAIKNAITSQLKKLNVELKGVYDLKEYVGYFSELVKSQEKTFQKIKDNKELQKKGDKGKR
jgi:hypothetical protein